MSPEIYKMTPPAPPTKLSYSCSLSAMSKKQRRECRRLFYPLTRPAHISPKKKVSWRLTKKWFNRYQKPVWLKRTVTADSEDGKTQVLARVTGVKISKAGGHRCTYTLKDKPI